MLKKLLPLIAAVVLLAAPAACIKSDPYSGDKNDPTQKDEPKKDDPGTGDPVEPTKKLPTEFLSAKETVANMGAGWNLGNTFDAHSGDTTNMWIECWGPSQINDYLTAWGQVPPTRDLFQLLHDTGFRAIRIPVTWYPHMGTNFVFTNNEAIWRPSVNPIGYDVDKAWMAAVKEAVDNVLAVDMYCIINVHHDTGTANTHWVVASEESYAQNCERFKKLWAQIAETFKDYDGRLLFEAYNEMTDAADSWCFASYNTPSHYDAAIAASAYKAVNAYAQDFVDVVRATGGNNADRNLIVNTYAAASGEGNWNAHLKDPLKEMKVPADKSKDHLAVQVHYYPSFSSLNEAKGNVDAFLSGLKTYLAPKGAPIIVGEWGCGDGSKINYKDDPVNYCAYAKYFVQQAKTAGISTFYWMGISDGADRAKPKLTQPDLAAAIVRGTE